MLRKLYMNGTVIQKFLAFLKLQKILGNSCLVSEEIIIIQKTVSFTPLDPGISVAAQYNNTPTVAEFCVLKKLIALNPAKASGPDGVPAWLLKENADLLAPVVTDILNCSYLEARLPQSWKLANVAPIPKQTPVYDVNKHLRPISLTPVLSKLAEDFVVDRYVKPAVLAKVDPRQFGTVPGSSTTEALISKTHAWYSATNGNWGSVRVILFDFKKAFDLIDHRILVRKLGTYNISNAVISWVTDFLTSRKQRVKLRLFTVLYFSVRLSRSSALRYGLPCCMSVKTTQGAEAIFPDARPLDTFENQDSRDGKTRYI